MVTCCHSSRRSRSGKPAAPWSERLRGSSRRRSAWRGPKFCQRWPGISRKAAANTVWDDLVIWPHRLLVPQRMHANVVPFSRSGGRSLGGISRNTRTDRGYWSISYEAVPFGRPEQRRAWGAIRSTLSGMAGQLAVPVWSHDSAPWPPEGPDGSQYLPHSDGEGFGDGALYRQRTIAVEMAHQAAIGETVVTLRLVHGAADLAGVRFSYEHALYETGNALAIEGGEWTLPIFPAVRMTIPAGAALEFDLPTCLVHLASDSAMDLSLGPADFDRAPIAFVEAVDHWNDLALDNA